MIDNKNNMLVYRLHSKNVATRSIWVLLCFLLVFSLKPVLGGENSKPATVNTDNKVHYPANLTECIEELKKTLPTKGNILDEFKSHPAEIAIDYHLTLGLWIRNNWIYSGDGVLPAYFNKMGIYHPDDMSGIILDSLWRDLHSVPICLNEQVEEYKKYWFYNGSIVRETRSMPLDVWNQSLSLNNGKFIKLSDFKGKVMVLLLFSSDILTPSAISALNELRDSFSKRDVSVIGFYEKNYFDPKDPKSGIDSKLTKFPLIAIETEVRRNIQQAVISPGTLGYPQLILFGKDGKMIVRFNEYPKNVSKKELYDEILKALN